MNEVIPYEVPPSPDADHADPAELGFPVMLPIELALAEQPAKEVCEAYGIDRARFAVLVATPAFQKAYLDATEQLKKEGVSFRMKARMQAEELLKTSWRLIHHAATPANVKADLIKTTYRVAGLEPKEGSANVVVPLQIVMHL